MGMLNKLFIFAFAILLIASVSADMISIDGGGIIDKPRICKNEVSMQEATQSVVNKIQVQKFQEVNVSVSRDISAIKKYGNDMMKYNRAIQTNQLATSRTKIGGLNIEAVKVPNQPQLPTISKQVITRKIPVYETKTSYDIDWLHLRIITKITKVPVYETQEITTNELKEGYRFDSETGKFYLGDGCQ